MRIFRPAGGAAHITKAPGGATIPDRTLPLRRSTIEPVNRRNLTGASSRAFMGMPERRGVSSKQFLRRMPRPGRSDVRRPAHSVRHFTGSISLHRCFSELQWPAIGARVSVQRCRCRDSAQREDSCTQQAGYGRRRSKVGRGAHMALPDQGMSLVVQNDCEGE